MYKLSIYETVSIEKLTQHSIYDIFKNLTSYLQNTIGAGMQFMQLQKKRPKKFVFDFNAIGHLQLAVMWSHSS